MTKVIEVYFLSKLADALDAWNLFDMISYQETLIEGYGALIEDLFDMDDVFDTTHPRVLKAFEEANDAIHALLSNDEPFMGILSQMEKDLGDRKVIDLRPMIERAKLLVRDRVNQIMES